MPSLQDLEGRIIALEERLANAAQLRTLVQDVNGLRSVIATALNNDTEICRIVGIPADTADPRAVVPSMLELGVMMDNIASRLEFVMREIQINRTVCGLLDFRPRVESITLWDYYNEKVEEEKQRRIKAASAISPASEVTQANAQPQSAAGSHTPAPNAVDIDDYRAAGGKGDLVLIPADVARAGRRAQRLDSIEP